MYNLLVFLHSWTRWAVLILGVGAIVLGLMGWFGRRPFGTNDNRFGLFYTISMDIQLVLGLLLYVVFSPITTAQVFPDFGAAMGDRNLRFWGVEHITIMIVAWVLAHVGRALSRRATTDLKKHRQAAIFYTLSLIAVLSGIPWSEAYRLFRGF